MSEIHIPDRSKPYIMAHRGNRVLYPENTISAFQQAVSDGADIIETDVQVSSDGAFLCIHDPTLERTTDGVGYVSAQSFEQLRSYNAAAAWPNLPHEPIPEARVALYRLVGCDALLSDHPGQTAQALGRRPQ